MVSFRTEETDIVSFAKSPVMNVFAAFTSEANWKNMRQKPRQIAKAALTNLMERR
jgi:hypothetical protein